MLAGDGWRVRAQPLRSSFLRPPSSAPEADRFVVGATEARLLLLFTCVGPLGLQLALYHNVLFAGHGHAYDALALVIAPLLGLRTLQSADPLWSLPRVGRVTATLERRRQLLDVLAVAAAAVGLYVFEMRVVFGVFAHYVRLPSPTAHAVPSPSISTHRIPGPPCLCVNIVK